MTWAYAYSSIDIESGAGRTGIEACDDDESAFRRAIPFARQMTLDEASPIQPVDALGAIARCRQNCCRGR